MAIAGLVGGIGCSVPAGASAKAPQAKVSVNDSVKASTTLAKLQQTMAIPPGTFVGTVAPANGAMRGALTLPSATTTLKIARIGLATVTVSLTQTEATTGTFNFTTYLVRATSTFNIHVDSVKPLGLPVNWWASRDRCRVRRTEGDGALDLPLDGLTAPARRRDHPLNAP
jgi:hypothetical protein